VRLPPRATGSVYCDADRRRRGRISMSQRRHDQPRMRPEVGGGNGGLIAAAVVLAAMLASVTATEAAVHPAPCDLRLVVGLTPDVPDPSDAGFLSSLVGNHPSFGLTLTEQLHGSVILAELTGPGPGYLCDKVIDSMRKDGRVEFVRVMPGIP